MSGEFAASELRVAVLMGGLVSVFVVSVVLRAPHPIFHLPYDIHQFPRLKPPQNPIGRKSLWLRVS